MFICSWIYTKAIKKDILRIYSVHVLFNSLIYSKLIMGFLMHTLFFKGSLSQFSPCISLHKLVSLQCAHQ